MAGKATIISDFTSELHVAVAGVRPQSIPAEIYRGIADRARARRSKRT
jgi:fructose-1-phosphate kinase PfkB-like protein